MELSAEVKQKIDKSVLCWLATVSADLQPNVSPKEIFTHYQNDAIIIANIASPQTVKNIRSNNKVCVSFIDVLVQKGYQLKGLASIVSKADSDFSELEEKLLPMTQGIFPFNSITKVKVESVKKILAPSYIFFPDTKEKEQIESAKRTYRI